MNINISFVHKAEPCSEKPKGCYETYGNLYIALWSGWEVSVSDTRTVDGDGTWSIMTQHYQAKPTQRQIRDLKKMIWRKCEIKEKIQEDLFALLSGKE